MGVRVDTPYILLERMIEMREKINWRQHVVLGLLLLSAILSLGGCGDDSASSASGSADSVTQVKEVTRKDGKNEKEIMADLNASSDFFNTITNYDTIGDYIPSTNYNPTAPYTVTSVSITKRKTTPKETDDVYVSVAAESEHTTFQGDYHLLYNYYDVGGWVLDQVEPDESTWQYLPKDPVPDDIVIADTYSLLPIQDGSVSDIQHHLEDQSDVVSYQVNSTYTQYSIVGTMTVTYDYSCGDWVLINSDNSSLTYTLRRGLYAYPEATDRKWRFIFIESSDAYHVTGAYFNIYRSNEWQESENDIDWMSGQFKVSGWSFQLTPDSIQTHNSIKVPYDLEYLGEDLPSMAELDQWASTHH